jgi:hypothetical protein
MGSRRSRGFAVPGPWGDLRVLRQPRLSKQACSTRLPSHTFMNGLVSMRGGHSSTRQRIRTRPFHPINVHSEKGHSNPYPSRPMRPRLAPGGKLAYLSGDWCRTPTQWHAKRGRTAAVEHTGKSRIGSCPSCIFMLKITACEVKVRVRLHERTAIEASA